MKIAFWSNVRGKSCVTSNLACMSVLSALDCPDRRTIVFENHQNILNLGSIYYRPYSNTVSEKTNYNVKTGLEKIFQIVEQGGMFPQEMFYHFARDFLNRQLFYFSTESIPSAEMLEYHLSQKCKNTLHFLEQYGDLVFVDTKAASLMSSRKILQEADIVVVNLIQNESILSHFFKNFTEIQKKAFYIIGNYEENRSLNQGVIMEKYHIPQNQIGMIPHCCEYADALSNGCLIPFLSENYGCGIQNHNYPFIAAAQRTKQLLIEQIAEKRKEGGSA